MYEPETRQQLWITDEDGTRIRPITRFQINVGTCTGCEERVTVRKFTIPDAPEGDDQAALCRTCIADDPHLTLFVPR